jgi:hypothetical protein
MCASNLSRVTLSCSPNASRSGAYLDSSALPGFILFRQKSHNSRATSRYRETTRGVRQSSDGPATRRVAGSSSTRLITAVALDNR